MISDLRGTLVRRACGELERSSRPKYNRRHPPRLQLSIDSDNRVATSEENDVDREAHEEHVHPHEWGESPVLEEHPRSGFQAVATEQAAALAGKTAGVLEPRA